jgi:CcmD family protein
MKTALRSLVLLLLTAPAVLAQSPQGQFVPVTPGQMQEPIPAAPLVFIAYGFVWVALAAYVFTIWSRLSKVERELGAVNDRLRSGKRA